MATKPNISDAIFGALIARRETIRTTSAAQAIQIIGSRFSPRGVGPAHVRRPDPSPLLVDRSRGRARTSGCFSPARVFGSAIPQS